MIWSRSAALRFCAMSCCTDCDHPSTTKTAFFGSGNTTYSNDAALFYVIYLFQQAFEFLHMGYASAMAWILFAIIMAITAVQLIVSRRLVYYEGEAPK